MKDKKFEMNAKKETVNGVVVLDLMLYDYCKKHCDKIFLSDEYADFFWEWVDANIETIIDDDKYWEFVGDWILKYEKTGYFRTVEFYEYAAKYMKENNTNPETMFFDVRFNYMMDNEEYFTSQEYCDYMIDWVENHWDVFTESDMFYNFIVKYAHDHIDEIAKDEPAIQMFIDENKTMR